MSEELLLCPFCGGTNFLHSDPGEIYSDLGGVQCLRSGCPIEGIWFRVDEWNTRHHPESVEAFGKIDDNFGANQLLKDVASQTHMIDIRIRLNGEYYWFEGDFLKKILPHVEFNRIEPDISATLEKCKGHLPESVKAVLEAARRAKALLDHKIHGEGEVSLVDIFDVLYVSLLNHDKGRQ